MVADEAEPERDARLPRVAERRVHAGVGHGHDDVGLRRVLPGQPRAEGLARRRDAPSEDERVGAREVDVLEDARGVLRKGEPVRRESFPRELDDLARLDVPLELRADQVERARLRRDDRRPLADAERERPDAVGVPRGEDPLGREDQERVGPADRQQAPRRWPR